MNSDSDFESESGSDWSSEPDIFTDFELSEVVAVALPLIVPLLSKLAGRIGKASL
jgi:hypothetical protein